MDKKEKSIAANQHENAPRLGTLMFPPGTQVEVPYRAWPRAPGRLRSDTAGSAHPIWALPPMDCRLGSCIFLGRQYEGCQASTASWPARHETNNA